MRKLTITQAKPNPAGKDRFGNLAPSSQLAGEWIDFQNTGDESYPLDNVKLHHVAYTTAYPNGVWQDVMNFTGVLEVGKIVRIHSGGRIPLETLLPVDRSGADYHLFTGNNYVWNNDRSDSPRLVLEQNGKTYEADKATYSAYPLEGRVLKRRGSQLV